MGNQMQLEKLYRQYAKPLYFYLIKLCGSEQLAEDLTQETFVRATIHLNTYQKEEPRAWLFKVARNVYIDEWRKRERRNNIFLRSLFPSKEEMISPYGIPEESLLTIELNQQIEDLLHYLPEQYRSVIYLREYEQFSYTEIMDTLQLTESQVKVTLHRARKQLTSLAKQKGWDKNGVE